ncbi:hypothetical protein EHP00_495 [Ecytonucleospora hepatopenaei]|uniref:Uncharacterized protein n=1 Tax=Ecytonucleospora hepatopenaei TaxID=646526 RepID=A0A1W0E461_9MICR|nr:hypothetical protein EHP00_495 [Ecytonucleospora hepatopenaei]
MSNNNKKLLDENIKLKQKMDQMLYMYNKIIQKAMQVKYYTFLEFEKMIDVIDNNIEVMENTLKNLHEVKESLEEQRENMHDKLKEKNIFNISFININNVKNIKK